MAEHHVVIIGAGFAGLSAAKSLKSAPVKVTIIDKQNHHLFQPLLYQVATAALSAPDIAAPIRKVLRKQKNATVLLADVEDIDRETKCVKHSKGSIAYDTLIVAAGAANSYFGHDEWRKFAPGLKELSDAFEIRERVLKAYENAELVTDENERTEYLTFVVIGGGPTGVEMAGALKEIATRTMRSNFRNFDPKSARVVLIEGSDRVLGAFPAELSKSAQKQLEDLGVEVVLNTMVKDIDATSVTTSDGHLIKAKTVVWAAGVGGAPLAKKLGVELDRSGRVPVRSDFSLEEAPEIFVIGDLAKATSKDGEEVPALAPAATQAGAHVAKQIARRLEGKEAEAFQYLDKGMMATIGRSRAVALSGPLKLSGWLAWMAWLFIHLIFLVDFRNRMAVLFEWAWAYVTFQRSARIIVQSDSKSAVKT
jgi:NADH dehydrogenase